ncbi:unnamed protein product [Trifolium pratense]|uniref:Uncharacterized protein n=1 Tax=Trifolium pratense TaxID=57577 RepID=A0ACB0KYL0_TRIPR|nr:unnamed protein product [Trifolium pratense]
MFALGWGADGAAWEWRRQLRAWEEEMLGECQSLLLTISLQALSLDRWQWRLDPDAGYTVRGAYQVLISHVLVTMDAADNLVWHPQVPLKVSIFAWRLLRDRLPTRVNLVTRRVLSSTASTCVFGCHEAESAHHLFISCRIVSSLWDLVRAWIGIPLVDSSTLRGHFTLFTFSAGVGSGTPTSAPRPPPAKRTREEDSPVEDAGMGGCSKFPVPRCFTVQSFFEKYPPEVFETERAAILDQEPEARRQQHARDMAAMVRMVSSSLVLGDERESLVEQLNTAQARHERSKGRINQLKIAVEDLKEKQKHWGDQLDEHRKRGEDLDAARAEIERLNAAMAPGENEHRAAEGLTTRADLVKVIAQLSHDFVEGTEYAFENAVQQIKCLNPDVELVTRGMHVNGQVKDGQIVIPAGLADSDEEEEDAEGVFEEGHEDEQDDVHEQEDRCEE